MSAPLEVRVRECISTCQHNLRLVIDAHNCSAMGRNRIVLNIRQDGKIASLRQALLLITEMKSPTEFIVAAWMKRQLLTDFPMRVPRSGMDKKLVLNDSLFSFLDSLETELKEWRKKHTRRSSDQPKIETTA